MSELLSTIQSPADLRRLSDAERRIELLAKDESGATTTKPLAWEEDER